MFTDQQVRVLRRDLHPGRVLSTQGQSYLAAWDVRAHLTRIFGYGGWDFRIDSLELAYDTSSDKGWTVGYRCTATLSVHNLDGYTVCMYSDAAVGGATNQRTAEAAHDLAIKSAVSGALKRCAVNLGTQFGLSLYNGGSVKDVVRVLVTDDDVDHETPTVEGDDG